MVIIGVLNAEIANMLLFKSHMMAAATLFFLGGAND